MINIRVTASNTLGIPVGLYLNSTNNNLEDRDANKLILEGKAVKVDDPDSTLRQVYRGRDMVQWGTGRTAVIGADGKRIGIGSSGKKNNPRLAHFFPGDAVAGAGGTVLSDDIGGMKLTLPNSSIFSTVSPDYTTVAALISGNPAMSAIYNISGTKPFFAMLMFTRNATGGGLAGMEQLGIVSGSGMFELWTELATSSSIIGNFGNFVQDTAYTGLCPRDDACVGMLVTPGVNVEFFYAGTAFWENNQASLAAIPSINPAPLTWTSALSSTTNGWRRFYGFVMYEFDLKPTDWKAAALEMRTNWLAGRKVTYSGWA